MGVPVLIRRRLLSGGSLSAYAVAGLEPELVLDFVNETYRVNGSTSTFSSALTYSGDGLRTMVDSDGVLKWAPHNLLVNSSNFNSGGEWVETNVSVSSNIMVEDSSNSQHYISDTFTTTQAKRTAYVTFKRVVGTRNMCVRLGTHDGSLRAFFNGGTGEFISTAANGSIALSGTPQDGTIDDDGYITVSVSAVATATNNNSSLFIQMAEGTNITYQGNGASSIEIKQAWVHRSDLPMVNNPDRGDSYVPTTSAAVYLPRRGNHVYSGTSWVNEGLLLESEARTNLLLNSGTLSTQNVTVTAVPHTLSFTGTGTITLSGASTDGPLVGTGTGENNRVNLTFTPSAGTLTCTVSGTVTNAQLEAASTPSSYIPTSGSTVTRAAETLTAPAANMPWPTPNVIGADVMVDGDFSDGSGWSLQSNWTISGGALVGSGTAADRAFSPTLAAYDVGVYEVQFDYSGASGNLSVELAGSPTSYKIYTGSGRASLVIFATVSGSNIVFRSGVFTGTIDNISVREIDPLAVSIQMDGTMTYADNDLNPEFRLLNWLETTPSLNYIQYRVGTTGTAVGRVSFMQSDGVLDSVGSGPNQYSPGVNVSFNVAGRHGSTFVNGAADGAAFAADTTPTSFPANLETADLAIGDDTNSGFMGNIGKVRVWAADIGDTGLEEATT